MNSLPSGKTWGVSSGWLDTNNGVAGLDSLEAVAPGHFPWIFGGIPGYNS